MKIQRQSAGFSLVELLIYMGLSSILLTIVAGLMATVLDTQLRSQLTSVMEQDSRFLIAKLNYEITQADEVILPALLAESGAELQLTTGGQPVILEQNNGNLEITKNGVVYQLNHSLIAVSNFQVTRLGNEDGQPVVKLNLSLTSLVQTRGQPITQDYQVIVGLR